MFEEKFSKLCRVNFDATRIRQRLKSIYLVEPIESCCRYNRQIKKYYSKYVMQSIGFQSKDHITYHNMIMVYEN